MNPERADPRLTVCVCTYNSARTLETCLASVRRLLPSAKLIVVDHDSQDRTLEISRKYDAEIHQERVGLGYARQLSFELAHTDFLAFVDSDVEVSDSNFFARSLQLLRGSKVGAIVGMSKGHRFHYGLPAGLLVLRKKDFEGQVIPSSIDARETYYIQARLNKLDLSTLYVPDAMIHQSEYRLFKPEWEGANTRLASGLALSEILFAVKVILLMSINSRSIRNLTYTPIFLLKFLRGFVQPNRWRKLQRPVGGVSA